ncbi:MAG: hypothetical protein M0R80_29695 [Proteobacteria bacterium]|jgi:hypothetical protein|nr:hypothetical protein [Pseudomonadota bacterium]
MRLTDLDACFLEDVKADGSCHRTDSIEKAQGVMFQCPKCAEGKEIFEEDGKKGVCGAHYVMCWFANPRNAPRVSDNLEPKPGRWYYEGTSLEDLTFTGPGAYSILLTSGCCWHGFIKNGDAS